MTCFTLMKLVVCGLGYNAQPLASYRPAIRCHYEDNTAFYTNDLHESLVNTQQAWFIILEMLEKFDVKTNYKPH